MTYEDICQHNQLLYGQLEGLTIELTGYTEKGDFENVELLKTHKNTIKYLINKNLDQLEVLWKTQAKPQVLRKAERQPEPLPTEKEQMIINAYKENPKAIHQIAFDLALNHDTVNRVITAYLTKKYCEV